MTIPIKRILRSSILLDLITLTPTVPPSTEHEIINNKKAPDHSGYMLYIM